MLTCTSLSFGEDVNINCTDETPIQEGMIVNLQCLAGLPYTLDLKEEFHFNDQNWTCDSLSNAHERSSERKHAYRNSEQNYNCELEISNAQTSDSGYYECSVSLPGHDSPVMSRGLLLQVQSAGLSTSGIGIITFSASGAVVLVLLLAVAVVGGAYRVYKRPHHGDLERQRLIAGQHELRRHVTTSRTHFASRAAQQRPEPELRRHRRGGVGRPNEVPALNKGRSLNSGDTRSASRLLFSSTIAQQRPEPELRRHISTGRGRTDSPTSLNKGRSLNSGDTARRRHVRPRDQARSTKAGA